MKEIIFPTGLHRQATEVVKDFFVEQQNVDTILLVNSLACGKATPDSDIDMAILISETANKAEIIELDNSWQDFLNSDPTLNQYIKSNRFAQIPLDIIVGVFEPSIWEDGGGIDSAKAGISQS